MHYSRSEAKEYAKENLRGIYSAFCLPETPDHDIDERGLRQDINHLIDVIHSDGLYVHGFYGNFWLLTTSERKRAMEIVADEVGGRVPIICRCAHQCLKDTLELVRHAEASGAELVSLIGPAYASGSEAMVTEYFEAVSAASDIGISVFNTPQAGYVISPETMAELAEIPTVCALKNGILDVEHTNKIRSLVGDRIVVVDPYEENFLYSLTEHGQQVIYTGTNYMYDSARATPMHDYAHAALSGDTATASRIYQEMQPVRDLHQEFVLDPWRSQRLCPVSTIKYWGNQLGLTGGPVRPPLPAFPEESAVRLHAGMQRVGLLDEPGPAEA